MSARFDHSNLHANTGRARGSLGDAQLSCVNSTVIASAAKQSSYNTRLLIASSQGLPQ